MVQLEVEDALTKKHKKWKDFEMAWNEYEETLEDKTALWSKESFSNFINPVLEEILMGKRSS